MEKTGNNKTYNISYEWGNPLDNCLPDEKLYHFGSFTDLFGGFPFDCDKKSIMMGCVDDNYPEICWSKTKSGELKKQNYDACDSLVCAIAYINQKRYGDMEPKIMSHEITENENHYDINYTFDVWGKIYEKHMTIPKDFENETGKPKKTHKNI